MLCPTPSTTNSATNIEPIKKLRFMTVSPSLARRRRSGSRHELLHALGVMLLTRVEVAARIDGDAADGDEAAHLPSAVADRSHLSERVALQHEDLVIDAVGDEDIALLRIARERQIPHRPGRVERD